MSAVQKQYPFAPTLTSDDNGNHSPGTQPKWQESALVAFVDPERGLACFHRIGIHPNTGAASLYSWTAVGGKIVSRAKRTGLPIPSDALTNTTLEGVSFETIEPLRSLRARSSRDGLQTDLVFESYTGPVQMNMDVAGATIGAGHYDSLGSVKGHIVAQGISHEFNGVGFTDHSWGARDGGSILAHRWIMAVRDKDNHVNVFPTWGPKGRMMLGYVVLDGTFSSVADVRSELHIADDHLSLAGVRATITDRLGRTVELQGRGVGEYNLQPYGQGYFCAHKPVIYESGGHVWRGMVEWSAMRFMPAWHREGLGLTRDNEWLQWQGLPP
jgi:hypothetical protein